MQQQQLQQHKEVQQQEQQQELLQEQQKLAEQQQQDEQEQEQQLPQQLPQQQLPQQLPQQHLQPLDEEPKDDPVSSSGPAGQGETGDVTTGTGNEAENQKPAKTMSRENQLLLLQFPVGPKVPPFVKSAEPCKFHEDPTAWVSAL